MATGLTEVRRRIVAAAERARRDPRDITLVGVSKYADDAAVVAAHAEGLADFGENRAQELAARSVLLPAGVRWHFVGRLQGNKVRQVRPIVSMLHSLDRPALAEHWVKGPGMPPPVLVQVNLAGEVQKGGVAPDEAGALIRIATSLGLEVVGLMTVPPLGDRPEDSRPWFRRLRDLRDRIRQDHPALAQLSMGMSDDFEVAVEEGATVLRIGRAIFDPVPPKGLNQ
ncbi:MAG: YggS family pyridoxal phosphate-dependent enzyme [Acidimicrobiia bacterium]